MKRDRQNRGLHAAGHEHVPAERHPESVIQRPAPAPRARARLMEEEKSSLSSSPRGRGPYRQRDPAGHLLPAQVGCPSPWTITAQLTCPGARRRAKHVRVQPRGSSLMTPCGNPGTVCMVTEETETYSDQVTSRRPAAERGPSPRLRAEHELRLGPSAETAPRPAVTPGSVWLRTYQISSRRCSSRDLWGQTKGRSGSASRLVLMHGDGGTVWGWAWGHSGA